MGFCLCEHALFLSELPCEASEARTACCGACEEGDPASGETAPPDDCVVSLHIEIEDYTWSTEASLPTPPVSGVLPPATDSALPRSSKVAQVAVSNSLRAPPPIEPPLFLRNLVFRI